MTISSYQIQGNIWNSNPRISLSALKKGDWQKNIPHSFRNLTECPCGHLDRFSPHGRLIREAYENAIVGVINTFFYPNVIVAVVGSGGLLQEACWLSKLFSQNKKFTQLSLHLIDNVYATDAKPVSDLAKYVGQVLGIGQEVSIKAWASCANLAKAMEQGIEPRPHLIVGMDTELATNDALQYQMQLIAGDVEKVLIVRWHKDALSSQTIFDIFSRKGSNAQIVRKSYNFEAAEAVAEYIKTAAVIGS